MQRNVLVLTMARARSSLVTHVFVDHGWNLGNQPKEADQWNRSGYWEHQPIKQWSRHKRGNSYRAIVNDRDPRLYDVPQRYLPEPPWVLKVDAFCWPALQPLAAVTVKLRRNIEGILRSCMNTPFMRDQGFTEAEWRRIIAAHQDEMQAVSGLWVDTDRLVMGDHRELRAAIEAAGGDYNPDVASALINA